MLRQSFLAQIGLPVSCDEAFAWHARAGAFERLLPPWQKVQLGPVEGGIETGSWREIRTKIGPIWRWWRAEHQAYDPPRLFHDVQTRGPFAFWSHHHRFTPSPEGGCLLTDQIEYALPGGWLGQFVAGRSVARMLATMFAYRHRVTQMDLTAHHLFAERKRMRILMTGATGLVGTALRAFLTTGGHQVVALRRGKNSSGEPTWDPQAQTIDAAALEGFDAVVHLAGENVGEHRWTEEQKKRIRTSRGQGTRLLCETLAGLKNPPRALIAASAIGYYGDRGNELMTESSTPGSGFLPEVCQEWEAATNTAQARGIRVANLRLGVVLTPAGGALKKMLLPFKLGGGGMIGNGQQAMSWIALDDVVGGIHHALMTESLQGPTNLVAPEPVSNREFTKTLGRVLRRPTIFPMPAFVVKLIFGQMGEELLLSSTRVSSQKLAASGYAFRFPQLEPALRHLLGK